MSKWIISLALVFLYGCGDDGEHAHDAGGACKLDLTLGHTVGGSFAEIDSGDPVELVLGFQGIAMLQLTLAVDGTEASAIDVISHLSIEKTGQALDQRDRALELVADGEGASRIEDYLIFVNDVAASEAVGSKVRLELIARTGDCQGTLVRDIELHDDDECVDFDIVLDASVATNVPDGSVACGDEP